MKKRKYRWYKVLDIAKSISFGKRMFLIYIIGGIIPFVIATFYISQQSRNLILEQNKKAQQEEVALIGSSIEESMEVATDVGKQIYSDAAVRNIITKIAQKEYKDTDEFTQDCVSMQFIDKYLEYYKEEIYDIKIYVKNRTIASNRYFSYSGGGDIKKLNWYLPTCYRNGESYWSYFFDETKSENVIQLTRSIQDSSGKTIAVLAVRLNPERTVKKVIKRTDNSVLVYGPDDVIATNFEITNDNDFLIANLNSYRKNLGTQKVVNGISEYLVTYQKIYPDDTGSCYTIVRVQSSRALLVDFNKTNLISIVTVLLGLIMSIFLILLFSNLFGHRIKKLREQMHLVAVGRYKEVEPIDGTDEAAELYQELEQMMQDIQKLTTKVVDEQVQKEKLHTKQKEVEFKMLASQINPHFLYNTLETIRMKAKINKEPEIEELVKNLAKIMRRNIQVGDQMVSLQSEITLIEDYLVIQNYRFGDRIHSKVIVDDNVDTSIMVIPLIMQPFVENAFAHGLESKENDGYLEVHVMQKEKDIEIQIKDNGAGMNYYTLGKIRKALREGIHSENDHIGINNVNQRITILYGEPYGVSIRSEEGKGTCITICFPAEIPQEIQKYI